MSVQAINNINTTPKTTTVKAVKEAMEQDEVLCSSQTVSVNCQDVKIWAAELLDEIEQVAWKVICEEGYDMVEDTCLVSICGEKYL